MKRNSEAGFTLPMVLVGMFVVTITTLGALSAVRGDTNLTKVDLDHKQAYEAAKAGIDDYAFHLAHDSAYWTHCTNVPTPNAVNQMGSTTKKRFAPGSTTASYAIELIPATGKSSCSEADPVGSMIEQSGTPAGTFRIRSTGFSGNSKVSLITTFKRGTFLDFMYFTQLETSDPVNYGYTGSALAGAYSQCSKTQQQGRYSSAIPNSGGDYCDKIAFISGDVINGPMHTNDALNICGSPDFGRSAEDSIEVSATAPGWYSLCNGSDPDFIGTYQTAAPILTPPPSNAQLATLAQSGYSFTGQVTITLSGTNMTVQTSTGTSTIPFPSNGVVYVANGTCSTTYSPFNVTYPSTSGCGNVLIQGTYTGALTIAAENDIIIKNDVKRSGSGMLGLIANNFVRVYHPCSGGTNQTGYIANPDIDAAILTINHSFIVDNYNCGRQSQLGSLNVTGAIAQKYRGAVGTYGSNNTGYAKNYVYDDRLHYLQPPNFIDPVQASWIQARQTTG